MLKEKPLTVFLLTAIALSLLALAPAILELRLFGVDQGYEPEQPLAFSHRLHSGELETPCLYCHSGAEKSRNAGVPPLELCMNCHRTVTAPFMQVREEAALAEGEKRAPRKIVSLELRKLYAALGLDDSLEKNPKAVPAPVAWKRVHNLPDFAYFDHRPHVNNGVECQACHGPVETMERIRQFSPLTMGWCVGCHRASKVSAPLQAGHAHVTTDCSRCHY